MKLLLDNGMPRSAASILRAEGIDTVHVGVIGLSKADDRTILERAVAEGRVLVTLDADFHTILALKAATAPSVIRVRVEGLKGPELSALLGKVMRRFEQELLRGAAITVGSRRVRCHLLPLK